jgi:ribonuclease P protein component
MIPPKAEGKGSLATPDVPSAVSLCAGVVKPEVMRNRSDFLRTASAQRQATQGFLLQARARSDDSALVRVGFTCSKKIGNAVARNRAKRRLRALAQVILPHAARPGWDYVLVGRPTATIERDFALLLADLQSALARVHANPKGARS